MMTPSLRRALDQEISKDEASMAVIARTRQDVRATFEWATERKLADGEHFRFAALAMASLGQPDEINPHRNSSGKRVTVGPYVSHAVNYVLHGVDCNESDRQLVLRYAMLINVARRL